MNTQRVCKTCSTLRCHKHCLSCGRSIKWRPDGLDPEIQFQGKKPLNEDETIHDCTNQMMKYPRMKASIIICPIKNCNFAAIEGDKKLIDEFESHMRSHLIHNGNYEKLKERIEYLRFNNHVHYIDPFLHVELQEIIQK